MEKRILVPRKMRKAPRSYLPYGDMAWLLQMLLAVLIIVILGLNVVLTGAEERPTPDDQTTIFDPSGTDPR